MKPTAELLDHDVSSDGNQTRDQWDGSPVASASKYPVLARLGIALAALVTFIVVLVIALPMVLPSGMTRGYVESALGDVLSQDIRIEGEYGFRLFPSVRLEAEEITTNSSEEPVSFRIGNLELEASTLSLLSGSLHVSALKVTQPEIQISATDRMADEVVAPENIDQSWGGWRDFQLRNISISGGSAIIETRGMTDEIRISDISLTDVPPAPNEAEDGIAFDGTAIVNGQNMALHIAASNPQLLASGNRWPLSGIVTSNFMSFGFEGSLAMRERLVGNGNIQFGSSDISALNDWLGTQIPHREASVLSIISPFELTTNTLEMKVMKISAGATEADANVKVTGIASGEALAEVTVDAKMLDFGDEPMMMFHPSGGMVSLPTLAGTLQLNWRAAAWGSHQLGPGNVLANRKVESGALTVKLEKALALDGIVRGALTLDRSEGMRAMHVDGTAVGVSFESLTAQADSVAAPLVSGAASIDLNLFSVGADISQLFEALSGTARLQVQDGRLSMPELVQGLSQDDDIADNNAVSFSTLNSTFNIAQGIAKSEDLILRSDGLSLVGQGSVDMAEWTVDIDIGQLKGGDGDRSLKQYRISGPIGAVEFEAIN